MPPRRKNNGSARRAVRRLFGAVNGNIRKIDPRAIEEIARRHGMSPNEISRELQKLRTENMS